MILLLFSSRTGMVVDVRTGKAFKRDLRMFIRAIFHLFCASTSVGFLDDSMDWEVLFTNVGACVTQRKDYGYNGLVGTIRVGMGEL